MNKLLILIISISLYIGCKQSDGDYQTSQMNNSMMMGLDQIDFRKLRNALPLASSYRLESADTIPIIDYQKQLDSILFDLDTNSDPVFTSDMKSEVEDLKSKILVKSLEICGENDLQNVELYDGSLGIKKQSVLQIMNSIGQIQWNSDFGTDFDGEQNSRGTVQNQRWCTGCLIGKDLFFTAGHCFTNNNQDGWYLPMRNKKRIPSSEIASLMHVNFNYQIDSLSNDLREELKFPIVELVEFYPDKLDFAIVRLGKDNGNLLPGDHFDALNLSDINPAKGDRIVVIQHPNGKPKKIESGELLDVNLTHLQYDDVDTESGSSGAPLIDISRLEIIGLHTNGGCKKAVGYNVGYSIESIRVASALID